MHSDISQIKFHSVQSADTLVKGDNTTQLLFASCEEMNTFSATMFHESYEIDDLNIPD